MAYATLTSSDRAAAMDHRNLELLLMVVMMTHSLMRKEGAATDDDVQLQQMKEMVRALSMAINGGDHSAITRELLAVTLQLLDEQLHSLDGGEQGRVGVSSSASNNHLMYGAATVTQKKAAGAAAKATKKRNKAVVKHKGKKIMSWLGGGIISLITMAAFTPFTTLIALSLIHQSDGSSEGKAPPSLPPTSSTSRRHRKLQSGNMASTSPTNKSLLSAVVESTIFSPAAVSFGNNRRMKADENVSLDSCSNTDWSYDIVPYGDGNLYYETYGSYDECKCNIQMRQCENTRDEDACILASKYCCGDFSYPDPGFGAVSDNETVYLLNSPLCYCDFYNYAYANNDIFSRCDQPQNIWQSDTIDEKTSLQAMYNELNGLKWKNNTGWNGEDKSVGHCQWYGISCDDEGYVTSINLKDNNLEGKFPVYTRNEYNGNKVYTRNEYYGNIVLDNDWEFTKYGLANLYKLKALDLSNNTLTGTIEYLPLYNLPSLTYFDVSKNQLTGEIDALVAPSLTHVDFSNNNFKSMRRFEKYKDSSFQSLRFCDVSNNAIQNDVADILESIPPNIEQFIASNNHINGTLPDSLNHLQKLRQFKMASNELSGELPGFADSLPTLYKLDVSTNGLTGPIPENIWRSLSLATLNLTGNLLTGTIPSTVGNLAVLEEFDLSNNTLSGSIPSELGQIRGASVFLKGNGFYSNITAPLSLCVKREVKEFDLAENATFCPIERNALSDLYDSAKGAEWTDQGNKTNGTLWLDEYESYCNWKGVTCDDNHVIELNLTNNGLSGRLSESIGKLIFVTLLDLSDNDIKGSIPTELSELSNLTRLRLSYNAFTGTAPSGLGEMKKLQLLQLQSNRITEMPYIPPLNDDEYKKSSFVADCGVPSAFDKALNCTSCTMCCNANEDCHPQEETEIAKILKKLRLKGYVEGYGYVIFAAVLVGCFCLLCCIIVLVFYIVDRRKNHDNTLTPAMEQKRKDEEYALTKIGKDSVYSYFVTNSISGWLAASATVLVQAGILAFFVIASEPELQDDAIDIKFAWKCPRDAIDCKDTGFVGYEAWFIFFVLMAAFLAKDIISGFKLMYLSAKRRHDRWSRIRYFIGGLCLCLITLFAIYVSAVYNKAIATTDTEMIANSVIVLFVMEMDEWIFSDLEAINEKWTSRNDSSSDIETGNGSTVNELNEEIALHKAQIAAQQEEIGMLRESMENILRRVNIIESMC